MSNGNLKNLLTDIADAIRAKEGSSDLINPQDFSTRIAGLSGGGSGSGEAYEKTYFGYSPIWTEGAMAEMSPLFIKDIRIKIEAKDIIEYIGPAFSAIAAEKQYRTWMEIMALCRGVSICLDEPIPAVFDFMGEILSFRQLCEMSDIDVNDETLFPRLTKEEFYDLSIV